MRDRWQGPGNDVPGYEWRDTGAATTTGRDARGFWDGERWTSEQQGSNQTSEPGPNRRWDEGQAPEQTSGLDRPPIYRNIGQGDGLDERGGYGGDTPGSGGYGQPGYGGPNEGQPAYGERRFGRPDEGARGDDRQRYGQSGDDRGFGQSGYDRGFGQSGYGQSGYDRRRDDRSDFDRQGDDGREYDPPNDDRGGYGDVQRFGDGRYGRPDEWSSRQRSWPGRPSRYEDANSGYGTGPGAGMGAGMYWDGSSARQDDQMRGHEPYGDQIPERGRFARGDDRWSRGGERSAEVWSRDDRSSRDDQWSGRDQSSGGFQPRESYAGRGPRNYRRSDQRIGEDINDRLTDDDAVDASDVSITIEDGVVVLEGSVNTRDEKRRAEDIAASVSGVSDVMNRLSVRQRGGFLERIGEALS